MVDETGGAGRSAVRREIATIDNVSLFGTATSAFSRRMPTAILRDAAAGNARCASRFFDQVSLFGIQSR